MVLATSHPKDLTHTSALLMKPNHRPQTSPEPEAGGPVSATGGPVSAAGGPVSATGGPAHGTGRERSPISAAAAGSPTGCHEGPR